MDVALVAVMAVVAVSASLMACGDGQPEQPSGDPHITGAVTSAASAGGGGAAIVFLVEQGTGDYDKASVTASEDTGWYRRAGDTLEASEPPDASALTGKRVEVRFAGAVAESYPVQGTAAWVIVGE
jgi:hypothetical protein